MAARATMSVANSEEGAGDADEIVVYNAYLLCLGSFSSCRTCPHLSKVSQQGVEEEAGRFDVWAINTGSCLDPSFSSSLDHSLRNSHSTREMVVLLLRAIRVNLDYASRIFDQSSETLHETGLPSHPDERRPPGQCIPTSREIAAGLSDEALLAVHGLVSQLKTLSIAIKRATADEYNVAAARKREIKNGIDHGASDELWAEKIVAFRFPDSSESLQQILSSAISFRMRRFRDWKRHYEKRQRRTMARVPNLATGAQQTVMTGTGSTGAWEGKGKGAALPADTDMHRGSTEQLNVPESLALSKQSFQSAKFEAPKSISQSTAVSVSVRSVVAGVFMDWPDPPRIAGNMNAASNDAGNDQVRCPYCFDLLDRAEMSSKSKWRKHLKKDLEPYHCFYPECQTLLKMFPSESQWVSHIKAFHSPGSWVCRMRPHTTVVILGTEDAFRQHLEDEHDGMYPKSRVDTIVKGSYRPAAQASLFDDCPMRCPASLEPSTERGPLVPHIANHLLSLALESLPERSVRSSLGSSDDSLKDSEEKTELYVPRLRGTIQDGLKSLPPPDFDIVSSKHPSVKDFLSRDVKFDPDRGDDVVLMYGVDYSHIPTVARRRRPLDAITQLKDPMMEPFIRLQKGVKDVSLFLRQMENRRRWRVAIIAASFLVKLTNHSGFGSPHDQRPSENKASKGKLREHPETMQRPLARSISIVKLQNGLQSDVQSIDPKFGIVRTAQRNEGSIQITSSLRIPELRWGVLAVAETPAVLIYMDIEIRKPADTQLDSCTISFMVSDRVEPKEPSTGRVRLTDYYGPKRILGRPAVRQIPPAMDPGLKILGFGVVGIGDSAERIKASQAQLHFEGHITASKTNIWYDTVSWELRRREFLDLKVFRTTCHVAFAVEYRDVDQICLRTSISMRLSRISKRRLKFGFSKLHDIQNVVKIQTPAMASAPMPALDRIAQDLSRAMEMANTGAPISIHGDGPQILDRGQPLLRADGHQNAATVEDEDFADAQEDSEAYETAPEDGEDEAEEDVVESAGSPSRETT